MKEAVKNFEEFILNIREQWPEVYRIIAFELAFYKLAQMWQDLDKDFKEKLK